MAKVSLRSSSIIRIDQFEDMFWHFSEAPVFAEDSLTWAK